MRFQHSLHSVIVIQSVNVSLLHFASIFFISSRKTPCQCSHFFCFLYLGYFLYLPHLIMWLEGLSWTVSLLDHPESETVSNIWGIPNLINFSERQSPPPTTEAKNVNCSPSASLAARTQPKLCQSGTLTPDLEIQAREQRSKGHRSFCLEV